MNAEELTIIRLVAKGDAKSFDELFEMYYPRIYVLALSRLHNASEAEEVSQQTMISVWQKLGTLKALEAFPAWVTRIAINNCNATLRRTMRDAPGDGEEVFAEIVETDEELLPEPYVLREDLKTRLDGVVGELGDDQREAVVLYYYNQLSVGEISRATGASQNTVKSRLSLARKYIRGRLKAEESRTGMCYHGVAGVALTALGPALRERFALLEPSPEAVTAARDEVAAVIDADAGGSRHGAPVGTGMSGETGPAYLDDLVAELRALSLVALPLVPAGGLWPRMDATATSAPATAASAAAEGDSLTLEDYLRELRNFKERVELLEQHFILAAEDMVARVSGNLPGEN